MEPLFSAWKSGKGKLLGMQLVSLQWGHVFSDVEIGDVRKLLFKILVASMGPRLFRRGNRHFASLIGYKAHASMGPRLFRRGNDFRPYCSAIALIGLQWGHVFSDVEITGSGTASRGTAWRFNGATSFQTWKFLLVRNYPSGRVYRFNGATSFQTWKCEFWALFTG